MSRFRSRSRKISFLVLPYELREQIYDYVLPHRTTFTENSIWIAGNINVMLVCRQVYHDCVAILYGKNVISISIGPAINRFIFRKRLSSGGTVRGSILFPRNFPTQFKYILEQLELDIHLRDTLPMGREEMIKGYGKKMAANLQLLAKEVLSGIVDLRELKINVSYATNYEKAQALSVLLPLANLRNVKKLSIEGIVDEEVKEHLEKKHREICGL